MKWVRRILFFLLIAIVSLLILLVIFISPIAKWAIEKYSVQYTGRQVRLDKLHINLLNGSIHCAGFKIFEAKSSRIFFQCNELRATIVVHKLLASQYELSEIMADKPVLNIIQKGNRFNFSDVIERFAKKPSKENTKNNKPAKWYIDKTDITGATIIYTNTSPCNTIKIERCNINIPPISWNNKVYSISTDFSFASGGDVKGKISFNKNTWVYGVLADINRFDIKPFYIYLKDYLKVKSLNGLLSTHLNITGNMHNAVAIAASGNIIGEKFSIIDNVNDKLTAFDKMEIQVDSINTEKNIYRIASVGLQEPYLKLEMYKEGYNFDRITTSPVATTDTSAAVYSNVFVMIADYIQDIAKNYVVSNYNADKFTIQGGQFEFIDYTLNDKFRYDFDSLDILSDRINSNNSKIYFDASATLNHSGHLKGKMDINPKDFKDFDIDCSVNDLNIIDFNPYSKYYVATPFINGLADYTNKTTVVQRQLKSDNILIINKIIAGKKDKTEKPLYKIPVRLAVAILRDVHGNIKLSIPVSGSLDDPKFKWGKIVWQVLGNLITKAATAPFRLLANAFGGKEEDYKEIDFNYLQTSVTDNQQKQLDRLVKAINEKPEIKLELIQVFNKEDEAEALAINLVKKKYLGIKDSITHAQQQQLNTLDISDSSFIKYIDSTLKSPTAFLSTQEKCIQLVGKDTLKAEVDSIAQQRNHAVLNYLLQQQVSNERIFIHNTNKPNDPNLGNAPKFVINVAADEDSTEAKKE
jgi:hypothetical protein